MVIKESIGSGNIGLLKVKAYLARDILKQFIQANHLPSKSSWLNSVARSLGHQDFNHLLADGRFHRKDMHRTESEAMSIIDTALIQLLQERLPASVMASMSTAQLDPATALDDQSRQHTGSDFAAWPFDLQIHNDVTSLYAAAVSVGAEPSTSALGTWLTFAMCHPDPPAYSSKNGFTPKTAPVSPVSKSHTRMLKNLWRLVASRTGRCDRALRGQISVLNALMDGEVSSHDAAEDALGALSERGLVALSTDPWEVALTPRGQVHGLELMTFGADWPEWVRTSWEMIRSQDERPCPDRLEPLVLAYANGLSCAETASKFAFEDWECNAIERVASDIDRQLTGSHRACSSKRVQTLLLHIDPKMRLSDRDVSRWSKIKPLVSLDVAVNGLPVKVPLVPTRPHPNKSYARMRPRRSTTGLFIPLEPASLDGPIVITMVWKIWLSHLAGSPRNDVIIRHTQELRVAEQEVVSGIISPSIASFEDDRYTPAEMAPVVCYALRDYVQGQDHPDQDLVTAIRHQPRFMRWVNHIEQRLASSDGEVIEQILKERIPLKTADLSHIRFKVY